MTGAAAISRRHLDAALAPLGAAVVGLDAYGTITYVAPQLETLLGYRPSEVEGGSLLDHLHPDDVEFVIEALARWDGRAGAVTGPRVRLRTKDGRWVDLLVDVATGPLVAPLGAAVAVVRIRDERAEMEQDLRQHLVHQDRLARLSALFVDRRADSFEETIETALTELGSLEYVTRIAVYRGSASEVHLVHAWAAPANAPAGALPASVAVAGNPVLERLAEMEEVELVGAELLGGRGGAEGARMHAAGVRSYLAVPMAAGGRFAGYVGAEVTIGEGPLSDDHHRAFRTAAAVFGDAYSRRDAQRAVTFRAVHDPVTGLANHGRFLEVLAEGAHPSGAGSVSPAVVLVDLEGFKLVNDALGHGLGDVLLRHTAERLRAAAPDDAELARLGGDDFACFVADIPDGDVGSFAAALVASVEGTVRLGAHDVRVRARGGVAHLADLGGQTGGVALLAAAEAALARATTPGSPTVARFDADLAAEIDARHWVESELPAALEAGHLVLHYQPEVDLRTGAVAGAEALLRWRHPQRGLLAAGSFVGLAEHMASFAAVTDMVLGEACRQQVSWARRGDGPGDVVVRVNLSSRDVSRPGLAPRLAAVVERTGIAPERLCVEITETAVLTDPVQAAATCREIRDLGIRLAIDDFGTGHWSMRSLRALPVDIVKIDRALVDGIDRSEASRGVVAAIVGLAARLGLDVVAEGIETERELEALRSAGCERGQGFLLGRPAPAESIADRVVLPGSAP